MIMSINRISLFLATLLFSTLSINAIAENNDRAQMETYRNKIQQDMKQLKADQAKLQADREVLRKDRMQMMKMREEMMHNHMQKKDSMMKSNKDQPQNTDTTTTTQSQ